ncbi:uncharacterized protein [Diadema setosum]|uniref:uncharacterized protein n=1 Tax=Diadema setosum TaxID=31175 RepID=UPI003B3A1F0C
MIMLAADHVEHNISSKMASKLVLAFVLAACLVLTVADFVDDMDFEIADEEGFDAYKRDPVAALLQEFEQDEELEKRGTGTGRFFLCRQPMTKAVCKCDKTMRRQSPGYRRFCRMV